MSRAMPVRLRPHTGSDPTVDTTPPAAPAITNASDNVGASQGTIGNNATTDDTTPTLNGTAVAGSTVTILEGATVLGTAVANGSGNWSFTTAALSTGSHNFTVRRLT